MMQADIKVGRWYANGLERRKVVEILWPVFGIIAPVIVQYKTAGKGGIQSTDLTDFAKWAKRRATFFGKAYQPQERPR